MKLSLTAFYYNSKYKTKSSLFLTDFFWISFTSTLTTCYAVFWWSSQADGHCLWKKSIQTPWPRNKHTSGVNASWSSSNVMGKISTTSIINLFLHSVQEVACSFLGHLFHIWALYVILYCKNHAHVQLDQCSLSKLLSSAIQSVISNRQLASTVTQDNSGCRLLTCQFL